MITNFIKHKVRPDDSLSSIAARIYISENDLKTFHNQNCGKMNKLFVNNLKGIEFILIPTHLVSEEKQKLQQQKLLPPPDYFLKFHFDKYSVEEYFEQSDNENFEFNYKIDLNIQEEKENLLTEIHVKNLTKNNATPDDKVSSLALECMKSLYPISYKISSTGKIESFCKHQRLIEKFKAKRNDIEDFYVGEISKKYLNTFEESISDETYFFRQMQSNLLYQVLFPNLEWFHKKSTWKEKFYVQINSFPLEFSFQTEQSFEDSELVETKMTGTLSERCSLRELLKGIRIEDEDIQNNINAEIIIQYFTYKTTKQLHEIKSSVNIWHQNQLFQKHQLQITQN
ncbi:LysM peptidoglycan-binding domain-containing protein [Chryseobacterium sp. 18068]|uniref:LysM peptidoglycan-binding domain-containing protein n=1 Tax=Chryseobacterium sp. 18068 TaxID=2681414 RepID=UPI001356C50E|nr:LysM domain-containing protein [Chryseobacterium sp. 18068]